jgi:hypothetical protein
LRPIERAIEAVRQVLEVTTTTVRVRKLVIESEEDARAQRFVSSPTVRVDGRDIVVETLESPCDSCTDLCGCSQGTSCRVWRYQGAEHTEAPVGLIVEALLREIAASVPGPPRAEAIGDYELPKNLRDFFAGRAVKLAAVANTCCAPSEQASCCEPAKAASCAGPEPDACGCR